VGIWICRPTLATLFRQAEQMGTRRDGGDEILAGLRGVGFEFGFIHGYQLHRSS